MSSGWTCKLRARLRDTVMREGARSPLLRNERQPKDATFQTLEFCLQVKDATSSMNNNGNGKLSTSVKLIREARNRIGTIKEFYKQHPLGKI
jgi:hypothetical protein